MEGTVDSYSLDRQFGFIRSSEGENVFVHRTGLGGSGHRYLVKGEPVTFETRVNHDKDNRIEAFDVRAAAHRRPGTVTDFRHDRGFGFIRPDEPDTEHENLFFHYSSILWNGSSKSTARPGDRVEFEVGVGDKGPQAIRVKLLDARPPLLKFAFMGHGDDQWLRALADKAESEMWRPRTSSTPGDYPILRSYMMHTFSRLVEEDSAEGSKGKKIAVGQEAGRPFATFNTGLVTPNQEQIFALFQGKDASQDGCSWRLAGFHAESDHEMLGKFERLPELANYFEDPSVLLYDRRCELYIDVDHVIDERLDRFPEVLRSNRHLARQALDAARRQTEQRVYRNYKTAIPQFHRGSVQLLLPICLVQPSQADLALVVSRHGNQYRGSTALTLEMAYSNARLLCRPDTEWLQP